MTSLPAKHGSGPGSSSPTAPRIGQVFLDLRRGKLRYLDRHARQLHKEGVPFLPSDLRDTPAHTPAGDPLTGEDLPLFRAGQEERSEEATFVLRGDNGTARLVTWHAAPLHDARGQVIGVLGSVSCGTPEPDWQALAGLAHDLRTPLQALKLLVELVGTGKVTEAEQRETLDRIRTAADRALSIGLDLLEWCRGPVQGGRRVQPTWFTLEPALREVVNEQAAAARQKSLTLVIDVAAARGWEVYADRVRLGRLLSNLLVNAVRYTTAGRVEFRAEWQDDGAGRRLSVGVVDTGAGISTEEQESIFQPFERGRAGKDSDSGGSGLGLAVVERLVEELGLELEVYSEFGRGSAFHLLIPTDLLRPAPGDGAPATGG